MENIKNSKQVFSFSNFMCECGANSFYATESWFLKGSIENKVLYLKSSGGGDGIEKIECSECGKELEKDIKIEFL